MMGIIQIRALVVLIIISFSFAGVWLWHYKPLSQMQYINKENIELKKKAEIQDYDTNKSVFEVKYQTIKDEISKIKKDKRDEINTTIGRHTIVID